jgi:hypothetical protein
MTAVAKKQIPDFATINKRYIFKLTDNMKVKSMGVTPQGDQDPPYSPRYVIKNPVQAIDPKSGLPRWARCLNGYATVWMDEQKDIPKESVAALIDTPTFIDGVCYLTSPDDYNKLYFVHIHPDFEGNQRLGELPKFSLLNSDAKAQAALEQEKLKNLAKDKAFEAPLEELLPLADYFGIKLTSPDGEQMKESGIRYEFTKAAEKNPKVFLEQFGNPTTKLAHIITEAIKSEKIDLGHVRGQAHWGETKGLITALDEKLSPVDSLVKFAMGEDKKSKDFMKKLTQ